MSSYGALWGGIVGVIGGLEDHGCRRTPPPSRLCSERITFADSGPCVKARPRRRYGRLRPQGRPRVNPRRIIKPSSTTRLHPRFAPETTATGARSTRPRTSARIAAPPLPATTPSFALAKPSRIGECELRNEESHREADARDDAEHGEMARAHSRRQRSDSKAKRQPAGKQNARGLSHDEPHAHRGDDSNRDLVDGTARERNARIGEGEHRHDAQRKPWVEAFDQALGRRHRFTARYIDVAEGLRQPVRRELGGRRLSEVFELPPNTMDEAVRSEPRADGCHESDDHPCDRGMNAGSIDAGPRHERRRDVPELYAHAEPLHREQAPQRRPGDPRLRCATNE